MDPKNYALKIYKFKTSNHKYDYKIRDFANKSPKICANPVRSAYFWRFI